MALQPSRASRPPHHPLSPSLQEALSKVKDTLFGGGKGEEPAAGAGTTTTEKRSAQEAVHERVEVAGPGTPARAGPASAAGPVCAPSAVGAAPAVDLPVHGRSGGGA